MTRKKIDYGIDLGTTNSSIARMENGVPIIKKSEGYNMDTTPSCVHINKKANIFVGKKAYDLLGSERVNAFKNNDPSLINSFEEFKRSMGTDIKYECSILGRSFSPEELSAETMKSLKSYIRDDDINAVVISVPAKFQGYQKDATKKAAELAGFQHSIIVLEPIAASMAYGVDSKSVDGYWVVFDFGGGTFDAALMKADEGIMKVVDTEGDNRLGGKNIDYAIVDDIILPYLKYEYSIEGILSDEKRAALLRDALKRSAEETKIYFSPSEKKKFDMLSDEPIGEDDKGEKIFIDTTVSIEQYEKTVKPIFQHAIDLTNKLLKNNKLEGSDLTTVLMVGGPTFSHTLRNMIKEQITHNINISIDPMTSVARGAALIASTKSIPEEIQVIDKSKIQLELKYPETTVETEEHFGIRVNRSKTEGEIPEKLFVEIIRQDKGWSSGKIEIKDDAEVLSIQLNPNMPNVYNVCILDEKGNIHLSEPDTFSIIHGFTAAGTILTFDLCNDAYEIAAGKQHLVELKGLNKNQTLPAKGTSTFLTQKDIRPGNKEDIIRIALYSGEIGTRGIFNEWRGDFTISGEQIQGFLPKESEVELIVEVDDQEMIEVSVSLPYLDGEIIEATCKEYKRTTPEKGYLLKEIEKASETLDNIEDEYSELDLVKLEQIRKGLNELDSSLEKGGNDPETRQHILDQLRINMKEIDNLQSVGEWPKVKQELTDAFEHLESTNDQFGDEKTSLMIKQLNDQVKAIIQKKDLKMAKDLTEQISSFDFAIIDKGAGVALEISVIKGFDDKFDIHEWKNRNHARQLINEAKSIIVSNRATKSNLRPIVQELFSLLPPPDQKIIKPDDDVLMI